MTLNYISCVSACLGRSPGALTCAKLERFVQGVRLVLLQRAHLTATEPRTSARGFFRRVARHGNTLLAAPANFAGDRLHRAGRWN